jgi:alkylation response protein AidB-like acyl-CoA dehydrogenase
MENTLVTEEFCRQDSSLVIAVSLADFASDIILRHGTEEQKLKYLIPITKGEFLSSGGFTEPDHGSDITFMNTTAVKSGDEYVINGVKTFITNGPIAGFVLVLCQTDPECKPPYRGQSVILVERDTPGFTANDVGDKMGIKMTATGELSFNNVKVPASNLVGKEAGGFIRFLSSLTRAGWKSRLRLWESLKGLLIERWLTRSSEASSGKSWPSSR